MPSFQGIKIDSSGPVSKRFSSVKIKAGDHFNRGRSRAASRIEM
jgi:hypothetical protein